MIYCDGGSTYSKILGRDGTLQIIPTQVLLQDKSLRFDLATGHAVKGRCDKYVNELVALAQGALSIIPDEDFTAVDIGSRDTKYVVIKNRQVVSLDWNTSCGGNLGFTLELLGKYYGIDYQDLTPSPEKVPVTCGLLGIEKIFDEINKGLSPAQGVAKFLHGMAFNTYQFCQSPSALYLSGGLTDNPCFLATLRNYCQVTPLGRDILLKGLIALTNCRVLS